MPIKGLWAAIPTPWDERGQLNQEVLEYNIERYAQAGADGVYTTDSDGEFYAIELQQFRQLVEIFSRKMRQTSMDIGVGVTWCHTQGIIDRLRVAREYGISTVHVGTPFWMELAQPDVLRFFEALAQAVPEARWVHYNNPNGKLILTGKDYHKLSTAFPDQFLGSKQGTADMYKLAEILDESPHLCHFVVETNLVMGYLLGAKGVYSYWVNTLPVWERRWIDACEKKDWPLAWQMQRKLWNWERNFVEPIIRSPGHKHAIVGRARANLTGFLRDSGPTRPPYYPVSPDRQQALQEGFNTFWADEIREQLERY